MLQTAVATATTIDPLSGHLVQGAVVLILGLQAWNIRTTNATSKAVQTITQALFGVTGDNGINGTVKQHAARLDDHEGRIAEGEAYIGHTVPERLKLWEQFKERTEEQVGDAFKAISRVRHTFDEFVKTQSPKIDRLEEDRRANAGRRQGDQ